jgi:hypothetical protein
MGMLAAFMQDDLVWRGWGHHPRLPSVAPRSEFESDLGTKGRGCVSCPRVFRSRVFRSTEFRFFLPDLDEQNLPDLDEQNEIVRRIDSALAEIDRLAAEAAAARRLLDRLDQAILGKAFRGELVPQDPNEPASVLLERIQAARRPLAPPGVEAESRAPHDRRRRGGCRFAEG